MRKLTIVVEYPNEINLLGSPPVLKLIELGIAMRRDGNGDYTFDDQCVIGENGYPTP